MVEPWHSPDAPDRKRANREIIRSLTSSPTDTSAQYHPQAYVSPHSCITFTKHSLTLEYTYKHFVALFPLSLQDKLMSECAGSIDSIKRVKLILSEEEQMDDHGLTVLSAADKTGIDICNTLTEMIIQELSFSDI